MTKIKICGLTRREDLEYAIDLGVDYAGIIMAPASPRFVDFKHVLALLKGLNKKHTRLVLVLMDLEWKEAEKLIEFLPFDLVQFHGKESPEYCESFHFPYIKVFSANELDKIHQYSTNQILLDSGSGSQRGGTGKTLDWSMIQAMDFQDKNIFIAGGLNAENVLECTKILNPFAVDISSGVEDSPGIKNHQKMAEVVKKVRGMASI